MSSKERLRNCNLGIGVNQMNVAERSTIKNSAADTSTFLVQK